jgi:hypothetical protein
VTKLIAVLYGSTSDLHDPALHARLAAAGTTQLQVNVDDAEVAPAMRFGPGDGDGTLISGFVTVWTDDVAATLAELAGLGGHVYRVTERRPVEPPVVAPGERHDTLANIAVLRKPEGMPQETYLEIWIGGHTPIASETQATFGYIQNIVEEGLTPGAPVISAIVEELFLMEGMTDIHAFYGSGGDDAELGRRMEKLMTSVARFGADQGLDLVPTSRYLYEV